MPLQTINLGTYANDGTGDDLRTAFEKVNENFTFLDNLDVRDAANLGAGSPVFASKSGTTFQFRSITAGNNLLVSYNGTTITLSTAATFTGNVTGNVTGNITGNVTGNVTGNLTGTATNVADLSDRVIADLGDVAPTTPTNGQVLTYQSNLWRPITPASNVIISDEGAIVTSNASSINIIGNGISTTAAGNAVTIDVPGLSVSDEGSSLISNATSFNFTGAGVTATNISSAITIDIPGIGISDEGSLLTTNATSLNVVGTGATTTNVGNAVTLTVPGLLVSNEGVSLTTNATTINFTGDGVNATAVGSVITVNVPASGGSLDLGSFSTPTTFTIDFGVF